jgi:iron(III) transport system permease protein
MNEAALAPALVLPEPRIVPRSNVRRPPWGLLAAGAVPAVLVLLPLGATIVQATSMAPGDAVSLLFRPLVGQLLIHTVAIVVACTLLSAVLGTGAAWFIERTDLPGRRIWAVFAAMPLAVPPFITSFAWVSISPRLQDFAGALLVVTSGYFPLVFLPVAAALRGLDPTLEDTGRALGLGPWASFFRVVLPQLRPALFGGMLLVALNVLVEFGAFTLLRFRTFTTELYAEYRTGLTGPSSALLACVLILLCMLCLVAEWRIRGRSRYARIARFAPHAATPRRLGFAAVPVLAGFTLLAAATLAVPLGTIAYWLTQHPSAATAPIAADLASLVRAALNSVGLGLAAAATTLILAIPLGVLAARHEGRFVMLLERTAYFAQGVPGIVVALALVSLTIRWMRPLYQSAVLLVLAYAILFLPLALVAVRAAMVQAERRLEEAGRCLGLGWAATAWRITMPIAAPGLGAAASLVFVSVVTELTATLLLAPIGTRTLATQVWADTSTLAFAAAAPYAAAMTLLSLLSAWLLARRFGRAALPA